MILLLGGHRRRGEREDADNQRARIAFLLSSESSRCGGAPPCPARSTSSSTADGWVREVHVSCLTARGVGDLVRGAGDLRGVEEAEPVSSLVRHHVGEDLASPAAVANATATPELLLPVVSGGPGKPPAIPAIIAPGKPPSKRSMKKYRQAGSIPRRQGEHLFEGTGCSVQRDGGGAVAIVDVVVLNRADRDVHLGVDLAQLGERASIIGSVGAVAAVMSAAPVK